MSRRPGKFEGAMTTHTPGPWVDRIDNLQKTLAHLNEFPWKDWDATRVREIVEWALDGYAHAAHARNEVLQLSMLAHDASRCLLEDDHGGLDARSARGFLLAIEDRARALLARIEGDKA